MEKQIELRFEVVRIGVVGGYERDLWDNRLMYKSV
jgi:hypothetical protein